MTSQEAVHRPRWTSDNERLLGFSDALFAIAITFLALDLTAVPGTFLTGQASQEEVSEYLGEHAHEYAVYFATFLMVGFLWWRHRLIFRHIGRRSPSVTWLNMALLALVAMMPYPAGVLGAGFGLGVSLTILLAPLTLIVALLGVIWIVAFRQGLTDADVTKATRNYLRANILSTLAILTIALMFALLSWWFESRLLFNISLVVCIALLVAPLILGRFWPPPSEEAELWDTDELPPDAATATEVSDGATGDLPSESEAPESKSIRRLLVTKARDEREGMRFMIFTDGVFAISVTVLALQLKSPEASDDPVTTAVITENFLSAPWGPYFVTFGLIIGFWMIHVRLFNQITRSDAVLTWLNLIVLAFIAFIPLPSSLLQEGLSGPATTSLYLATLIAIYITLGAIRIYGTRTGRLRI